MPAARTLARSACTRSTWSQRVGVVLALLSVTSGCTSVPGTPSVVEDIEYIEGETLDIHRAAGDEPVPVVVVLHGVGLDRLDYREFATELAAAGALVLNADWNVLAGSSDVRIGETACAVRYAAAHAAEFGGDPKRLVVVGHSAGAIYAGRAATDPDIPVESCPLLAPAQPAALMLVAPAQLPGGPGPWSRAVLGGNPELKVAVVHGLGDGVVSPRLSERTAEILEEAGYEVALHLIPGGHYDLLVADTTRFDDPEVVGPGAEVSFETTIEIILDLAD